MAIGIVDDDGAAAIADLGAGAPAERLFVAEPADDARRPIEDLLVAGVRTTRRIGPGESAVVTFLVAWHFPRTSWDPLPLPNADTLRREYARRFADAEAVAAHAAARADELVSGTERWTSTWYDSTLPYWFLDRTMANTSTLATATCYRLVRADDPSAERFYGWEGTYCCPGTCQHVWQYAQAVARLFPALERNARETVDFGLAWREDGAIDYRAEAHRIVAHDGLAGTILRAWREHQMAPDGRFLAAIWPRVRRSLEFLLAEDRDADGLLEGAQYNTLDATWYGPMAWISSLSLAALRAGEAMARTSGDDAFAAALAARAERGSREIVAQLFNGDWFVHRADPAHPEANSTNDGCHIDQVFGQSYAWQLGLPRVVPEKECVTALRSLYRYSFAPDIGPYRAALDAKLPGGRWYAMPGEGGLLMCTWPPHRTVKDTDAAIGLARGQGREAWAAGYFVECMSGFEHQVASHMIAEGLVDEGLAIERMIHDRYDATKRNPYNEVECSDHYARAMASYGAFVAISGFTVNGPVGEIGFAPRLTPEAFRAAFVAATGWGTFAQSVAGASLEATIALRHGALAARTVSLETPEALRAAAELVVAAWIDGEPVPATVERDGTRALVRGTFDLREGQVLRLALSA
jgi:non-lysosomal glucosylceramidase